MKTLSPEDKETLDRAFERYVPELYAERTRQIHKWGSGIVNLAEYYVVLGEEFGEVGRALLESDYDNLRTELTQLAACCLRMKQIMDDQDDAERKRKAEMKYNPGRRDGAYDPPLHT